MKVLLTTITSMKESYVQLGIYNIKTYIDSDSRYKDNINIGIHIEKPQARSCLQREQDAFKIDKTASQNLIAFIKKNQPDILGLSVFVWNVSSLLYVAQQVKKEFPNMKVVLGGPEVSQRARELVEKKYIDYVIKNEGEVVFKQFLMSVLKRKSLETISGLCFKDSNNAIIDNPCAPIDLTKLLSPYLTGQINLSDRDMEVMVETTRGCPYHCAYCTYWLASPKLVYFPLKKVCLELKLILQAGIKKIALTDDNFNIDEKRASKILKTIIKYKWNTEYIMSFLNAYSLNISNEFADLYQKAGLYGSIGVQTYNEKTLRNIARFPQLHILEKNLKLFKEKKIRFNLSFIIGLPGDQYDDIKASIDWAYTFFPDHITIQELQLYHGTTLRKNAKIYGIQFRKFPPYKIIRSQSFNQSDIRKARRLAHAVYLYYAKKHLFNTTNFLIQKFQIKLTTILERWLKICKQIIPEKTLLLMQSQAFINTLITELKITISPDEKKLLDGLIKEDVNIYFSHSSYYPR